MLKFNERAANTVQNPESPDKVLFLNPDGVLQLKDSTGVTTSLVAESSTGQSTARPFKVYKALLTQSGTDAPVATVLENTLGGTVVWEYRGVGTYRGQLVDAFTNNKTFILANHSASLLGETSLLGVRVDDDFVEITSFASGVLQDVFVEGYLLIEVYP